MLTIGIQTMMDTYICLSHLTAGIAIGTIFVRIFQLGLNTHCCSSENIFNAFATAAFFKFIIISFFQMRYLLLIWKSRCSENAVLSFFLQNLHFIRRTSSWDDTELMRRELGALYTSFCT